MWLSPSPVGRRRHYLPQFLRHFISTWLCSFSFIFLSCFLFLLPFTESWNRRDSEGLGWLPKFWIHANSTETQKWMMVVHHQQQANRPRRSISSVLVETVSCEHMELVDCSDYGDKGMRCMLTATGMPCCICNGRLRLRKWRKQRRSRRQQRRRLP